MLHLLYIFIILLSSIESKTLQEIDSLYTSISNNIFDDDYMLKLNLKESEVVSYIKNLSSIAEFYEQNSSNNSSNCLHNLYLLHYWYSDTYISSSKELALLYLRKRINLNKVSEDSTALAQSYYSYGYILEDLNDFENAIAYYDTSFQIGTRSEYKVHMTDASIKLSSLLKDSDPQLAKFYLDIAIKYTKINKRKVMHVDLLYDQAWWNTEFRNPDFAEKLELARKYAIENNVISQTYEYTLDDLYQYYQAAEQYIKAKNIVDDLDSLFIKPRFIDIQPANEYKEYISFLHDKRLIYSKIGENLQDIDNRFIDLNDNILYLIKNTDNYEELHDLYSILFTVNLAFADYSIEKYDTYMDHAIDAVDKSLFYLEKFFKEKNILNENDYYNYIEKQHTIIENSLIAKLRSKYNEKEFAICEYYIEKCTYLIDEIKSLQKTHNYFTSDAIFLLSSLNDELSALFHYQGFIKEEEKKDYHYKSIEYTKKAIVDLNVEVNFDYILNKYKEISFIYYWLDEFDKSKIYNLQAIEIAEKYNLDVTLIELYYDLGEIYINQNKFEDAISNLIKSQELFRKNNKSYSLDNIKNIVNHDPRIIQLLSYCYHKLKLPEVLIANADYYKSFKTKGKLGINPDIEAEILNIQDNLKYNQAIIAYTNCNVQTLYESTGIKKINNPLIIYLDKTSYYSTFMFDPSGFEEMDKDTLYNFFSGEQSAYNNAIDIIKSNKRENDPLKLIYSNLILPIEHLLKNGSWNAKEGKYIDITEITIIPDSYLYKVPFEALINNENEYLINNYDINYSNSFSLLAGTNDDFSNNNKNKVLAIGDPEYEKEEIKYSILSDGVILRNIQNVDTNLSNEFYNLGHFSFSKLPGAHKELNLIEDIFDTFFEKNTILLLGDSASEENLKNMSINLELNDFDIIHFACHAFYNEDYPYLSSLVLSTDNNSNKLEDGFLTIDELSKLKLNAKLVNLSACQTARGEMYTLEGVDGFVQSFFNAGAQSVLSTLWAIEDKSATIFMESFYNNYKSTKSFSQAINKTKSSFINGDFGNKYKDPYFWSPYVYFYKN